MRFKEIISEKSFADVGVRGGKFYLAARPENLNDDFFHTGKLHGVKGISSSKTIWSDFSPNVGRNIFFVMDAADVVRTNKVTRIGYNDVKKLLANNASMLGRIMSINDVAHGSGDNIILGCFPAKNRDLGDSSTVTNFAMTIAEYLRKGEDPKNKFPAVDSSTFGNYATDGLNIGSVDAFGNLYYQAAKAAGYYGKAWARFLAPQNRSKWYPAIEAAIIKQANVWADESEWIVQNEVLTVPDSTYVILAIPAKYAHGRPADADNNMRWNEYDERDLAKYEKLMKAFSDSRWRVKIVEAGKAANSLVGSQGRRRIAAGK